LISKACDVILDNVKARGLAAGDRLGTPAPFRRGTREALVDAAERLFGENGINAVSLREVAEAAGQRNNSVVRYQFGSRQGLVDAIFAHRMGRIDERRRAMLVAAGPNPEMRQLIEAFVFPLVESIGHDDGISWYARFLRQVMFDPTFDIFGPARHHLTRGLQAVVAGLRDELSSLPEAIRNRRLLQMAQLVVHSLADHEAQMAQALPVLATPLLAADLVDCAEAVLAAPMSADTERELALFEKRQA
jgi:AcrR family transcriptional regulator